MMAPSGQTHLMAIGLRAGWGGGMSRPRKAASPFRCFNFSPEVIRLVVIDRTWGLRGGDVAGQWTSTQLSLPEYWFFLPQQR